MIESILIILLIIAVILLVLAFEWKSLTITIIDIIFWLILSISIYSVEVPYQYTSGGTIVEATQTIQSMYPIGWLFTAIAIIMMIYVFILGTDMLKGKFSNMM